MHEMMNISLWERYNIVEENVKCVGSNIYHLSAMESTENDKYYF